MRYFLYLLLCLQTIHRRCYFDGPNFIKQQAVWLIYRIIAGIAIVNYTESHNFSSEHIMQFQFQIRFNHIFSRSAVSKWNQIRRTIMPAYRVLNCSTYRQNYNRNDDSELLHLQNPIPHHSHTWVKFELTLTPIACLSEDQRVTWLNSVMHAII